MLEKIHESFLQTTDLYTLPQNSCYHCGQVCVETAISFAQKVFCCQGCRLVYELLQKNHLDDYYQFARTPGKLPQLTDDNYYDYLNDPIILARLINFDDGRICRVTFSVPQIHCISCIWLLERLYQLHPGFARSEVNFPLKTVEITFLKSELSLKQVVQQLAAIGYEPRLTLDSLTDADIQSSSQASLYIKLGVAGFCFGNIMLLSFPEYLGLQVEAEAKLSYLFNYLNLLLTLPVLFYSGADYFHSAWRTLRLRVINIDVPLALGMVALFLRSAFEILTGSGAGYCDSLAGLIFFLLTGKVFQQRTYDALSFERDYKSYFPLAVARKTDSGTASIPLNRLQINDHIWVRNHELIPADARLISESCQIDYSFVTGEAALVTRLAGEIIYAGGRLTGPGAEFQVVKDVSQSYLTRLWNNEAFKKENSVLDSLTDRVSRYFTAVIVVIATAAGLYWLPMDIHRALNAFTAVLIIACPCALALTAPYTLGTALRFFGRNHLFLKHPTVVEKMAGIDTIVFDKTGTLTQTNLAKVQFIGQALASSERQLIKSLTCHSHHPYSQLIQAYLAEDALITVTDFAEIPGSGLIGTIDGCKVKIGSPAWLNSATGKPGQNTLPSNQIYVAINGVQRGYFEVINVYRNEVEATVSTLRNSYHLVVLSGDGDSERERLRAIFGDNTAFFFNQSPQDKLDYIRKLQAQHRRVMMIGDGLNDAGALKQSHVGIAITDDVTSFSPACDGILDATALKQLEVFLQLAQKSMQIIKSSFRISWVYNAIGLSYAVSGHLLPVVAAILMPLSSITVVVFVTGMVSLHARRMRLE